MIPASVGKAANAFPLLGEVVLIEQHGDGLIHDTFVVHTSGPDGPKRFILQRINERVFAKPEPLMENIERVVTHVQQKASRSGRNPERAIPSLMRTKTDCLLHRANCESWRMLQYVEGTTTIARAPSVEQAHQIGSTFGQFLDDLADFAPHSLQNVLPGYRDTERYLATLWQAVSDDSCNRAKDAREEIAFVKARVEQTMRLQNLERSGRLPLRVIHGDTKLNNVLLDIESGAGVCAIDLDTVMPGLLLHDIGDCVREAWVGMSAHTAELSDHDLRIFEALVSGFVSSQSQALTELESASIVAAVSSITLELGIRFLCDYLSGDIYFRTASPQDNLLRAQGHFRLQQRIEASLSELRSRLLRIAGSV
jgi:Ser/Thr protein kinase RdoA (MazF antagonist)